MAMAASALVQKKVRRIILTRPAVEAGERLGFLPGDLAEKVNPYLRPLYDALNDNFTALFEEHPHHGWVDSALAAISYEHFFKRMVAAAEAGPRRSEHK